MGGTGEQILIVREEGLDRFLSVAVVQDEIAVVETIGEGLFDDFVIAAVLAAGQMSLSRRGPLPVRQAKRQIWKSFHSDFRFLNRPRAMRGKYSR